jgi:hypothetical protein
MSKRENVIASERAKRASLAPGAGHGAPARAPVGGPGATPPE